MQLASATVTVAGVLRAGQPVACEVLSRRHVMLDPKGVGYVLRKGKFCPIVAVVDGDKVTIETLQGTLPESAGLVRAATSQPKQPSAAASPKPVRGAAASAPAKGSPEAKAKMAELRAKRAAKPEAKPAKPLAAKAKADPTGVTLNALAQSIVRLNDRMDRSEQAFAAFVAKVFKA
jgi:hypothetical protein